MFNKTTLKNGLQFITVPMSGIKTVTILVLISVGSRYETKKINGVSHLVEHLAFKGTEKRPTTFAISKELDSIGAEFNAFTGDEYTGYFVKALSSHLEKSIEVLSDIVLNPLLRQRNIEEEKKVIIEEIKLYKDTPTAYADQLIDNLLFKGTSLGFYVAGTQKSVKSITKKDIVDYRKSNYTGKRTLIAIAGDIKKDDLKTKIEKSFSLSSGKEGEKPETPKRYKGSRLQILEKPTEQAHLRLAVYGLKREDPRRYAYNLLGIILGGSMSSRLFEEVREKRSLAYYVGASADSYTDCGSFLVKAGADRTRLEEAVKVIKDILLDSITNTSAEEVDRAREVIKGQLAMEQEESDNMASFYGFQGLLDKKVKTYEEVIKRVDFVTKNDIKKVAKDLFLGSNFNLVLVGKGEKNKLLKILGG